MLGRKPLAKWAPVEVLNDVEAAFFGDSEQRGVRAAAVLRYVYGRLPKREVAKWEAEVEDDRGLPSHGVFEFDFDEEDRFSLYMEHDKSVLIRNVERAFGIDGAVAAARAWVGEPCTETNMWNLPGIYQSALVEAVTGVERFWNEEELIWWLPGEGEARVVRKYPPPANEPVGFHVMAMPKEVKDAQRRAFLLSPTVEDELHPRSLFGRRR